MEPFENDPDFRSGRSRCETVSSTEARAGISKILNRASYNQQRTIVEQHGRPVAAVIPIADLVTLFRADRAVYDAMAKEVPEDLTPAAGTLDDALRAATERVAQDRPAEAHAAVEAKAAAAMPVATEAHKGKRPTPRSVTTPGKPSPVMPTGTLTPLETVFARVIVKQAFGLRAAAALGRPLGPELTPEMRQSAHQELDRLLRSVDEI